MDELIRLESIQERDIDLLLIEELSCSERFLNWFLENTVGKACGLGEFKGCWHSVCHPQLGESDLVLKFAGIDGKGYIMLIENKIAADFQPDQALRYRQRGDEFIKAGECSDYSTVLVAPSDYLSGEDDFDFCLAYEDIRSWYENESALGERGTYKAHLLMLAIEELRRGYHPIRDESTTTFWRRYWECVTELAPELNMKVPRNDIPKRSVWFSFQPKDLPKGISLIHKADRGYIDLQLSGRGDQIEQIHQDLGSFLEPSMVIVRTGKSAVVRIEVPLLFLQQDFDSQKETVQKEIQEVKALHQWAVNNLHRIRN